MQSFSQSQVEFLEPSEPSEPMHTDAGTSPIKYHIRPSVQEAPAPPAPATSASPAFTGDAALEKFQELLKGLKHSVLSRGQVNKMEDMIWDLKAELYAAEKRGRSA
jgi:hypothetical protein